jgi:alkylation response protein AidB-like acyl-CoA dehydrogenase
MPAWSELTTHHRREMVDPGDATPAVPSYRAVYRDRLDAPDHLSSPDACCGPATPPKRRCSGHDERKRSTMTTIDTTAPAILRTVHDLAPTIVARATEIESARRLPADLLGELIDAGCLRMLLPASHGGHGVDLPTALRVYEALARADGSVGWTVAIGASSWCDLAGLPRSTFDALYAGGPDALVAGAFAPSGTAVREAGGYRVNGRWAFVSGCEHSDWIFGNCVEMVADEPQLRIAVFTPSEVQIEDTWHVSGLCGTGSHHVSARDVLVPADRTMLVFAEARCLDVPIVRVPTPALFSLEIAGVALGIAQGALDDVLSLATDKVPLLAGAPLAANALFQHQLATADTELRAARALLHADARDAWATAAADAEFTLEQRGRIRATAAWVSERAVSVVDTSYRAGGGSSVYLDSPLQRRLRDIHALSQHFLVRPDTLTTAGAVLAGQDVNVPVF